MTTNEVWKKFDETELTHSSIHHLFAIHALRKEYGYARAVDVASFLDISRASVSITVHKLRDKGYVEEDPNKYLLLSEKGKEQVNDALSKRRIINRFFKDVLELPEEEAEVNACKVEHLISKDAAQKLISFIGYYLSQDKKAQRFREGIGRFRYACENSENCQVCEQDCYIRENEEGE